MDGKTTRIDLRLSATRKDFEDCPKGARANCVAALTIAAEGGKTDIAKPMKGTSGKPLASTSTANSPIHRLSCGYNPTLRESGYFVQSQTFSVNAKFNKSAVNRLPTYRPGEDERRDIVIALDAIERKLTALQAKRNLLTNLFRTTLHQLMTAQIRVHELRLDELPQNPGA